MIIKTIPIKQIHPAAYNPRKDLQPGDPEYKKLKKSLTEFDCVEPLVWNETTGNLVGGHQRLKVLKDLGRTEVEVSVVDLDDAKEKALNLALNKISGEWDLPRLKDLLEEINTGAFDIEVTGFDDKEIEKLMTQFHVPEEGLTDEEVIPEVVEPVCKKGDLWQLGEHRLLCGDATKAEDIQRLMGGRKADMVFTDPPYNVNYGSIVGHPSYKRTRGRTRISKTREGHPYWKDREAKGIGNAGQTITNDNMSPEAWDAFVRGYMQNLMDFNTGSFYICMSNKEMYSNKHVFEELGGHWASFIIWNKDQFVMGMQDYQRKYEPLLYGWKEGGKHHWCGDRNQSDVWDVKRPRSSPEHPTMKPIALCERAINNSSLVGNIVLDTFGGSGSTLIAAEKLGRKCYMSELEEHYCDVILKRWEDYTGKKATLATGRTAGEAVPVGKPG